MTKEELLIHDLEIKIRELERESRKKKMGSWAIGLGASVTLIGLILLLVVVNVDEEYHTDRWFKFIEHISYILIPLGIIEMVMHLVFTRFFVTDLSNDIQPVINRELKFNKKLAEKGIEDILKEKTVLDFLEKAEEYFTKNANLSPERKIIRILCIHINNLGQGTDRKIGAFKKKVTELVRKGVKVQFLIPNLHSERMKNELYLRYSSRFLTGKNEDVIAGAEDLHETIKHLEEIRQEHFDSNLGEEEQLIQIKYFDTFISFPLINYDTIWFKGNYMVHIEARKGYYTQAVTDVPEGIAREWKKHFEVIWDASPRRCIELPYMHAGEIINNIGSYSIPENSPFKNGRYIFRTHSLANFAEGKSHYFTDWVIEIGEKGENCFNCTLKLKPFKKNSEDNFALGDVETYAGVMTYHPHSGEHHTQLIFVFKVPLKKNGDIRKDKFGNPVMGVPYIISGLIKIRPFFQPGDFEILQVTYANKENHTLTNKIGVLFLDSPAGIEPDSWEITQRNLGDEDLLLLIPNKVIMAPPTRKGGSLINSRSLLTDWYDARHPDLIYRAGKWRLFYFVVEDVDNPAGIKHLKWANLEIKRNGSVILTRVDAERFEERYYGELNSRYSPVEGDVDKVAFIKLLRTHRMKNGKSNNRSGQDYRELFIALQWPRDSHDQAENWTYTRGLVLSDRDTAIFPMDKKIAEAARCLIGKLGSTFYMEDGPEPTEQEMQESYKILMGLKIDFAQEVEKSAKLADQQEISYETIYDYFYYKGKDKKELTKLANAPGTLIVQYDRDLCG